jgi:hypothetical protein
MHTGIKLNYPAMICLFVAFLCLQGCTGFEEEFDSSTAKNIFDPGALAGTIGTDCIGSIQKTIEQWIR